MTDSTEHRHHPDRSRINLSQDYEVRYWTEKFGCTEEELRRARCSRRQLTGGSGTSAQGASVVCPACKALLIKPTRPGLHLLDYFDRARCPECLTLWRKVDGTPEGDSRRSGYRGFGAFR